MRLSFVAVPVHAQRQTQELAAGWKFIREEVPGAAVTDAWTTVTLPLRRSSANSAMATPSG
jgi:hypothetical protein